MYNRSELLKASDFFLPMSKRQGSRGVYFVRIDKYSEAVKDLIWQFHEAARMKGAIIEGQITNPDERQLEYFRETIGESFENSAAFIEGVLKKWMPRMAPIHQRNFSVLLNKQLDELRHAGKNENILKNIYSKVMCWLYYKFERLMPYLGCDVLPKILYEGSKITAHELALLRILSAMGVDILLVETMGDRSYLLQDPSSSYSQLLQIGDGNFPNTFSLKVLRQEKSVLVQSRSSVVNNISGASNNHPEIRNNIVQPRTIQTSAPLRTPPPIVQSRQVPVPTRTTLRQSEDYFQKTSKMPCTNAWMKNPDYREILTPVVSRGNDENYFYNTYVRVRGVEDKLTYVNDLYRFYQNFGGTGRKIVVVDEGLSLPGAEEVQKIRRHPYHSVEEMIIDLAGNLPANANVNLQRMMQQSFANVMKGAAQEESNINRLVTAAVYLLCWILRYQAQLFGGQKEGSVPCFVLMGGCQNHHDVLYIRYLAKLPVDVLILVPDLNSSCSLTDNGLLDVEYQESLPLNVFPKDAAPMRMTTAAANAELDLNTILYSDTGMFRNRQFAQANAITLKTTYDEIFILWNQEVKYRPNFSTTDGKVNMPVIYAKISGVDKGNQDLYWHKIKELITETTTVFDKFPLLNTVGGNQYQSVAVKAIKNNRLSREVIRSMNHYPFALLREELQEHIFDKIQMMLDQRIIKGTFVNGTEYTVVSSILNLSKDLIRRLQSFDFTRIPPKIVVINTGENGGSLEDAIILTFLNLVGFDVAVFIPTGYQTVERYLQNNYLEEHQAGDYLYDLSVPNFQTLPPLRSHKWLDNILKRGI